MSAPPGTHTPPRAGRRRKLAVVLVTLAVVAVGLVAAIFVPVHSASREISLSSGTSAGTTFNFPQAAWVTVHFDHPGAMPMEYWMSGPGGGMMFHHGAAGNGDSYSFWSNGGSFECWAGFAGGPQGPSDTVWVNATWGLL